MKKKILSIIAAILVMAAIYLLFSLIYWSFNPLDWSSLSRIVFGITGFVIILNEI